MRAAKRLRLEVVSWDMAVWWTSIAGIVIIAWTLREIFRDLFQPSATGSLSSFVAQRLFRVSKTIPPMMRISGPLSIVVVIFCWTFAVAAGFALIYWGRFPQAFHAPMQESREPVGRFWTVLYFSLASLTTLGGGELEPTGQWVRIVSACESLIGMLLITASISWIVFIYPALGRMRSLGRRANNIFRAQDEAGVDVLSANPDSLLVDLAAEVIRLRVDFIHFPLIYYFHADTEGASLPRAMLRLIELCDQASDPSQPAPRRLSAAMLRQAITDMAGVLTQRFLRDARDKEPAEVFRAMMRDHREHLDAKDKDAKDAG